MIISTLKISSFKIEVRLWNLTNTQSNLSQSTSKSTKVTKWIFASTFKRRMNGVILRELQVTSRIALTLVILMMRTLTRSLIAIPSRSQSQPKGKRLLLRSKMAVVKRRASTRHGTDRKLLPYGTPILFNKTDNACNRKIRNDLPSPKLS